MSRSIALPAPDPTSLADIPQNARGLRWVAWASVLGARLDHRLATGAKEESYSLYLVAIRPFEDVEWIGFHGVIARARIGTYQGEDQDRYELLSARAGALLAELRDPVLVLRHLHPAQPKKS